MGLFSSVMFADYPSSKGSGSSSSDLHEICLSSSTSILCYLSNKSIPKLILCGSDIEPYVEYDNPYAPRSSSYVIYKGELEGYRVNHNENIILCSEGNKIVKKCEDSDEITYMIDTKKYRVRILFDFIMNTVSSTMIPLDSIKKNDNIADELPRADVNIVGRCEYGLLTAASELDLDGAAISDYSVDNSDGDVIVSFVARDVSGKLVKFILKQEQ